MSVSTWQSVGAVAPAGFGEARHQVHNAAQWLARMAHSYAPQALGNAHVRLRWDGRRRALVTREFLPDLALELRPGELAMQFREGGRPAPHVLEMDDRTPAEVEAWVLVELLHRRVDRDRFSKALPYPFPNLMTGDAVPYVTEGQEKAFAEVAAWLANGASVLAALAGEERGGGPADLDCWPEVLHLGLLLPARPGDAGGGRQLRVALSLGSAEHPEPCFYAALHDHGALGRAGVESTLAGPALAAGAKPAERALEFLRGEIARLRATA